MYKSLLVLFMIGMISIKVSAADLESKGSLLTILEKNGVETTECKCKHFDESVGCGGISARFHFQRNAPTFGRGTSSTQTDWGSCFVTLKKPNDVESYVSDLSEAGGDISGGHKKVQNKILRLVRMTRQFDSNRVVNETFSQLRINGRIAGESKSGIEFSQQASGMIRFRIFQSHTGQGDGYPSSLEDFDIVCSTRDVDRTVR